MILCMLQPKFVRALILMFFISIVTIGIFFLLSKQLAPFGEIVGNASATRNVIAEDSSQPTTPTATMQALTLDMLATVEPTATPTAEAPEQPSASFPVNPNARVGVVTSDSVNIRSYPSISGEVVGQAKQGDRLEIILISNDGQWVQVCCPLDNNGSYQQSWVAAEFIDLPEQVAGNQTTDRATGNTPPSAPVQSNTLVNTTRPSSGAPVGTVNGALVNLRSGPGTNYDVVGQVSEKTPLEITGRNEAGTWWQICCLANTSASSWISADLTDLPISHEQAMVQISIVAAPPTAIITATNRTN